MGRGGRAKLQVRDSEIDAIREYYDAMGLGGSHADIRKLLRRYSFEQICEAASVKYGKDPRAMSSAFGNGAFVAGGCDRTEITRSAGGAAISMRRVDGDGELLLCARKTGVTTFRIFLKPVDEESATKYHSSYVGKVVSNLAGTECVLTDCRAAASENSKQAAKITFRRPESAGGSRRVLCALASAPTLSLGSRAPAVVDGRQNLVFRDLPDSGCVGKRRKSALSRKNFSAQSPGVVEPVPSTKNLILSRDGGTDHSSSAPFEFCKFGDDSFFCRFERPFSAFEAFALCLSAIHRKW
eukprot:SAG31_NODE_2363_length_5862_cov_2.146452_1_plen_297_part_00